MPRGVYPRTAEHKAALKIIMNLPDVKARRHNNKGVVILPNTVIKL